MNSYEMMYILRPDLGEEQTNKEVSKYRDFLEERGASSIEVQNRGRRRLAYPIQKLQEGVYVQVNYIADGSQIAPLERAMRLSEEVMRFFTLKLEEGIEPISPEQLAAAEAATAAETLNGSSAAVALESEPAPESAPEPTPEPAPESAPEPTPEPAPAPVATEEPAPAEPVAEE